MPAWQAWIPHRARPLLQWSRRHTNLKIPGVNTAPLGASCRFTKRCVTARCSTDLPGDQIARPRSNRATYGGTRPPGHGPRGKAVLGPCPGFLQLVRVQTEAKLFLQPSADGLEDSRL